VSEILIIGGGPAGCAAARLLALWGHDVRLVTRPSAPDAPALAESIPPSARKLWSVLGAEPAIDAAGFVRATGNTVWWGHESRVETFDGGERGWQVTDVALARILLDLARDAGARVDMRLLTNNDAASIPAAVRLDCSGRAGLLARACGGRQYEPDLRTVALAGIWRHAHAWPVPDETHTLIESYVDGWAWSVPIADGTSSSRRSVAVLVDPRTTDLARGQGARDLYLAEIAKTSQFAAILGDAELLGRPVGWDASMYFSERYAAVEDSGDDWLLVGDAGSFVDPISSAGVTKALASGWLAAVVAHTCLVRPALRSVALDFFHRREQEVYAGLARQTRQFLGLAAGGHAHPFWTGRSGTVDADAATADLSPARLSRDPSVAAAFERIRAAPAIALGPPGDLTIEPRPAVSGLEIVLERRIVSARYPAGVRFVCDVDVVTLIDLASAHTQVPDLFDACVRQSGPIALPDFLTALATAVARGWLVWR
jgi:2-polyprenyl-6-methoxyphenol hydroxylase-like FAD-dependent oxidoreductase